jgi:hypothetical protein
MSPIPLGSFGFSVDVQDDDSHLATALTIEGLGFGTLWINGGALDRLDRLTDLLRATTTAMVGSSIISPDRYGPADVAQVCARAEQVSPGRLVVGLGSSHRHGALALLQQYLDELGQIPRQRGLLAAFGPRALSVARAGVHRGGTSIGRRRPHAVGRTVCGPRRESGPGQGDRQATVDILDFDGWLPEIA